MALYIPTYAGVTPEQIKPLLTDSEQQSDDPVSISVRVSFPIEADTINAEEVTIERLSHNDAIVPGINFERTESTLTFDTRLIYITNGLMPSVIMMHAMESSVDISNTYYANFRINRAYFRCPLGTTAGEKWKNGEGVAVISLGEGTERHVDDIEMQFKGIGFDSTFRSNITNENDKTFTATCVMANGGVNFGGLIE